MRFTGSPGAYERVFDFGNGPSSGNIVLARFQAGDDFVLHLYEDKAVMCQMYFGLIVQDSWMTIVIRYMAESTSIEVQVNGEVVKGSCSGPLMDRTLSNTYVGRSHWSGDAYFNGEIGLQSHF